MYLALCIFLSTVPSGTPLDIVAQVNSSRVILVQWNPPQLQEQNGVIVGYKINVTSIVGGERFSYETTELSLIVVGLTPHTTYECIVAAMTNVGAGPFSGIVTVQTSEEGE